jgi:hypothetical protein
MKPTVIDIVPNVVVRDYIQHFWQVATDIVNLNSDGKNKYELRREAEKLIMDALIKTVEWNDSIFYKKRKDIYTIELLLYDIWRSYNESKVTISATWYIFCIDLNKTAKHLEDEYTRRLNQLIDKSNAS